MSTRKQHSAKFKAKVALEALKGLKTIGPLAQQYEVHPTQISHWKRQLMEATEPFFVPTRSRADQSEERLQAQLYEQIGRLKIENDFLKKKATQLSWPFQIWSSIRFMVMVWIYYLLMPLISIDSLICLFIIETLLIGSS